MKKFKIQIDSIKTGLICLCLVITFFGFAGTAAASDAEKTRPKIGLALSGGGARGAAHVGVIKVLEEMKIPIDYIAGTSMGAIIGGLYAAGTDVEGLTAVLNHIDWKDAFQDSLAREDRPFVRKREDRTFLVKTKAGFRDGEFQFPKGVVQGQKMNLLLQQLTMKAKNIRDFNDLKIPFRAVATDLETGEALVLKEGDLGTALRASMSIPGALEPVEIDGHLLVDGGVSNNLPINVVREMGADIVIAVSIGTPLSPSDELTSVFSVTSQLTTIMTMQNTRRQIASLKEKDILIEPDLGNIGTGDFERSPEAIPIGEKEALEQKKRLVELSLPRKQYENWNASLTPPNFNADWHIDFIRFENNSDLSDEMLRTRMRLKEGEAFDRKMIEEDIGIIYGLDVFQTVTYDLIRENEKNGVVIQAEAKEWGPNFVQLGLSLESSTDGDAVFNIGGSLTQTAMNSLGGEWRTEFQLGESPKFLTRFFQPLDYENHYFIEPQFQYGKYNIGLFNNSRQSKSIRVTSGDFSLSVGRQLGRWGEFRFGALTGWGDAKVHIGEMENDSRLGSFRRAGLFTAFSIDTLDNVYFPHIGNASSIRYYASIDEMGADESYQTLDAEGIWPFTWNEHTLIGSIGGGATLSGDPEAADRFQLGGFLNLSGLQQRELSGDYYGIGRLVYYYRLDDTKALMTLPTYLGGSFELGNTWDDSDDINYDNFIPAGSVFIGLDTILGPLYLAGGLAEGGNSSLYLFLGTVY